MISWSPVQLKPAWLTGVPSLGPDSDNSWVVRKSIHIIAPYRDFHAHFSERLSALKSIADDMTGFLYLLVFIALHKRQDLKQDLWFASFQDASFEACHLAQRSVLSRIKWHLLCCLFPKHVSRRYQGLGSVSVYCAWGIRSLAFLVSLVFLVYILSITILAYTRSGWCYSDIEVIYCRLVTTLEGHQLENSCALFLCFDPSGDVPRHMQAFAKSILPLYRKESHGYILTGHQLATRCRVRADYWQPDMLRFFRCSAPGGGFGHVDLCCWTTSDEKRGHVTNWPNLIWNAQQMLQICRSVTWWLCLLCSSWFILFIMLAPRSVGKTWVGRKARLVNYNLTNICIELLSLSLFFMPGMKCQLSISSLP